MELDRVAVEPFAWRRLDRLYGRRLDPTNPCQLIGQNGSFGQQLARVGHVLVMASTTDGEVLAEGRKRQLRRMLEALGCKVVRLRRVRIAGLRLGDLPSGTWRRLSAQEVVEKLGRHGAKSEVRSESAEGREAGGGER